MGRVVLDFGTEVDLLNKSELAEALAEDARLRQIVAGIKPVTYWANSGVTGGASQLYTTPQSLVASGRVWAVMNVGLELAVASQVRMYLNGDNLPAGAPAGKGRAVNLITSSAVLGSAQFSKGQLMLNAGETLTFFANTASAFILSVFIMAISCPAERVGELLV